MLPTDSHRSLFTGIVFLSVVILSSSLSHLDLKPLQSFSHNMFANIRAAGYMLIGSVKAFYWVKPTLGQFLLFSVTALASNFLFSWLASDEATHFNQQGLISYLVWPMVMLMAGLILARRHHNAMLIFVPSILWLVADTMMALLQSLFQWLGQFGWLPELSFAVLPILFTLLFLWQALALLWIFGKKLRWSWLERVVILLGAFVVFSVWQQNVRSQPIFQSNPEQPLISEAAFYAQPQLLQDMLDKLQPQRPNVHDWYFLGVAGHGEQDVFRSEIELTKEMLDRDFAMQGRTAELINNSSTMQVLPIASNTSIERALVALGKRMDVNQDVLLLSLTSHGDQNFLDMSNPPLALEPLEASALRKALDKSGIKWRVIVVSACYSGSFIDELQSPTTLIITASATDKTSFGCINDAVYTYFGQAFWAESLPKLKHFQPAFNEAKQSIAKREKLMGFDPSEPQWWIGSEMQKMLPVFEQNLKPQPVTKPMVAAPTAAIQPVVNTAVVNTAVASTVAVSKIAASHVASVTN